MTHCLLDSACCSWYAAFSTTCIRKCTNGMALEPCWLTAAIAAVTWAAELQHAEMKAWHVLLLFFQLVSLDRMQGKAQLIQPLPLCMCLVLLVSCVASTSLCCSNTPSEWSCYKPTRHYYRCATCCSVSVTIDIMQSAEMCCVVLCQASVVQVAQDAQVCVPAGGGGG